MVYFSSSIFLKSCFLWRLCFFFTVTPQLKAAITSFFQEIPLIYLNGRDLKDSFMILSDFSFIFLLRNFIYDMSPSAEKEIKITPYGGGIEGKHSPKIYPQGYSLSFLGHGLLKLHFRILADWYAIARSFNMLLIFPLGLNYASRQSAINSCLNFERILNKKYKLLLNCENPWNLRSELLKPVSVRRQRIFKKTTKAYVVIASFVFLNSIFLERMVKVATGLNWWATSI